MATLERAYKKPLATFEQNTTPLSEEKDRSFSCEKRIEALTLRLLDWGISPEHFEGLLTPERVHVVGGVISKAWPQELDALSCLVDDWQALSPSSYYYECMESFLSSGTLEQHAVGGSLPYFKVYHHSCVVSELGGEKNFLIKVYTNAYPLSRQRRLVEEELLYLTSLSTSRVETGFFGGTLEIQGTPCYYLVKDQVDGVSMDQLKESYKLNVLHDGNLQDFLSGTSQGHYIHSAFLERIPYLQTFIREVALSLKEMHKEKRLWQGGGLSKILLCHGESAPHRFILSAPLMPMACNPEEEKESNAYWGKGAPLVEKLRSIYPTPEFSPLCAPELLKGEPFDTSADLWVLGALIYELTFGSSCPCPDAKGNFSAPKERIPPSLNVLLRGLLHPNPQARLQIDQVLSGHFLSAPAVAHVQSLHSCVFQEVAAKKYTFIPIGASSKEEGF